MKKIFLFIILCTSAIVSVMAQSATFESSADGSTLIIKASGDLTTNPSIEYITGYQFSAAAVNHVYTSPGNLTSCSVAAGATYDITSSTNYYLADYTYTQIFDGGAPVNSTYAYNVTESSYTLNSSYLIFVSTDGGTTKKQLQGGQTYTYTSGETFYVASATFTQITDKDAFRNSYPTYFKEEKETTNFITALNAIIANNSYTEVKFTNEDNNTPLKINNSIVSAILCPTQNNTVQNNTTIKVLDLGQTTADELGESFFAPYNNQSYRLGQINLDEITIPLVPADAEGNVIVPTNAMSLWSNQNASTHNILTKVHIPTGYTQVAEKAFYGLGQIITFTLPLGITKIGNSAFENSGSITGIDLPEGITYIGKRAFMGTSLREVKFPSTLDKIDDAAFANLNTYDEIVLNEGLRFIGNAAFCLSGAINKTVLNIPSSVKYIGPAAFGFRWYHDVYYASEVAPVSPFGNNCANKDYTNVACFDGSMLMGNDGNQSAPSTEFPLADNNLVEGKVKDASGNEITEKDDQGRTIKYGYANRENYQNNNSGFGHVYFGMLHFPQGLTTDQYDTFKDHTRIYLTESGTYKHDLNNTFNGGIDIPLPEGYTGPAETEKNYKGNKTSAGHGGSYSNVTSGFVDTYRGDQYIWPSQQQWMRAFVEASCGYNWDGVTKYRPTLTEEQIALMVEDGEVCIDGVAVDLTASTTLTEAQANAYNATLLGAWTSPKEKTSTEYYSEAECLEHNSTLEGAIKVGDVLYYTTDEINAHNASLTGAISTSTVKEPAVESHDAVYYDQSELEWVNNVSYVRSTLIYHPKVDAVYYTDDEIALANGQYYLKDDVISLDGYYTEAYLSSFGIPDYYYKYSGATKLDEDGTTTLYKYTGTGAKSGSTALGWQSQKPFIKTAGSEAYYEVTETSVKASTQDIKTPAVVGYDAIYYTQEEANAYNATLEGAWNATTVKGTVTPETAAVYNASLSGAWTTNTVKTAATYYTDEEINTHNAGLAGAKEAGSTLDNKVLYADGLSMIAFMGTRQFVFSDADYQKEEEEPEYIITLGGHNWWTICVPFNMTKAQVDKVFGTGTHVCLFSGVERDVTSENKKITLKFQNDVYAHKLVKNSTDDATYAGRFNKTASAPGEEDVVIYAHEPYMIFPTLGDKDAVTLYKIKDYKTVPGSPVPTIVTANDYDGYTGTDHTEYRFIGNYTSQVSSNEINEQGKVTGTKLVNVTIPQYSYMFAKKSTDTKYKFWFYQGKTMAWKTNKCVVQATDKNGGENDNTAFFTTQPQAKQASIFGEGTDMTCDVNGDDTVDNKDMQAVLSNICGNSLENADVNGDGVVDIRDLNLIISNLTSK